MKVTDPDGGIHSIGKRQFEGTGNERDDKVVEWPKEGWTSSLGKAPSFNTVLYFRICLEGETARKKDEGRLKANKKGTLCLRLPMSWM